MATNRKRKLRTQKAHIPLEITKKYFEGLDCRDYANDPICRIAGFDPLNEAESKLLREFYKCNRDFERWKKKFK
jgi:hypothetical protein